MGWQGSCYMTYGEANSGKTLTLEKDKTYRITYYAANWDGSNTAARSMKCEITGNSGEGTILTREDVLRGKCNNGKPSSAAFVTSPDFIQATFTPTTTGAYTLKFTSVNTVISNIKITDNTSDRIVYTSSLDPYGYSTIYLGDNVAKPEGVSVYTAALTDDGTALTLTELEGDVIPANAGLILKGEANAALTFSPPTADATVPTVPTTNALTGTLTGMKSPSDADIYILGYTSSSSSAFWKHSTSKISTTVVTTIDETNNKATITTTTVTTTGSSDPVTAETTKTEDYTPATEASEGTEATKASHEAGTSGPKPSENVRVIPANKAYLSVSISKEKTGAPSIRLQFASDEEEAETGSVTAIERIEPASAPVAPAIYDLSGRRLTEMTKPGLYIVNGHKKVVR
jgi:hypothetical protein